MTLIQGQSCLVGVTPVATIACSYGAKLRLPGGDAEGAAPWLVATTAQGHPGVAK